MKRLLASLHVGLLSIKERFALTQLLVPVPAALGTKRRGAVAFEYVLILLFMVLIIIAAFTVLEPLIANKIDQIKESINSVNPGTRR